MMKQQWQKQLILLVVHIVAYGAEVIDDVRVAMKVEK